MNNNPIGIFDSGVGGLSIWKEINQLMPNEPTIYLADSINAPYGQKTKQEILDLCIKNTEFLLSKGCKLIVVACNTATTNAISYLRENYSVPFVGIEPAIKPAALNTQTKSIGVLATKGTLTSKLFNSTTELYASDITIVEQIGKGLVELIEAGKLRSKELESLLLNYVSPMVDKNIDYLVLGCTHYPFLIPILNKMLPDTISIIDSGFAVAKQTKRILNDLNLFVEIPSEINNYFFTNADNIEVMQALLDKDLPIESLRF